MNHAIQRNLEVMEVHLNHAFTNCAEKMKDDCDSVEESFDAMATMIEVLSEQHCKAIWAMVGSTLAMNKEGIFAVPHSALRETVDSCIKGFSESLTEGITASCKDDGYPNIFDPNEAVREEILNGNL